MIITSKMPFWLPFVEQLDEIFSSGKALLFDCNSWVFTLLLNEGISRALKGKKLRLKNPMLLPFVYDGIYDN